MKGVIGIAFGLVFLVLSIILIVIQIFMFTDSDKLSNFVDIRLIIIFFLTSGSIIVAGLALSKKTMGEFTKTTFGELAGALAFLMCIVIIIAIAYQLLTGSKKLIPIEYGILIAYAVILVIYGIIGVKKRGRSLKDS